MGQYIGVRSQLVGTCDVCAALSVDVRSSDTDSGEEKMAGPSRETTPILLEESAFGNI